MFIIIINLQKLSPRRYPTEYEWQEKIWINKLE